jgi:hypothetical protein
MSNYDILTLHQKRQKHIEFAIKTVFPRLFYSWSWRRVLKAELDLLGRYDNIDFKEANYQKYGQGATEVLSNKVSHGV